jgi:hypothetical protein
MSEIRLVLLHLVMARAFLQCAIDSERHSRELERVCSEFLKKLDNA